MKNWLKLALVVIGVAGGTAQATVSLQFVNSGFISNLANAAGVPSDNMQWGIVISTSANGFAGGGTSYDTFANIAGEGFLGFGGLATDDYYIPGGLTQDSTGVPEVGGANVTGAPGTLGDDINDVALTGDVSGLGLGAGITTGDIFGIIWFNSTGAAGAKYGFFTDASFVIPGVGGAVDYSASFLGTDPIRSASNTFQTVAAVPEPSRVLLLALGALGLVGRRRRA